MRQWLPLWLGTPVLGAAALAIGQSERFKEDPQPLVNFAQAVNLVKMGGVFTQMTLRGEMTWLLMKRWINPSSLVTM